MRRVPSMRLSELKRIESFHQSNSSRKASVRSHQTNERIQTLLHGDEEERSPTRTSVFPANYVTPEGTDLDGTGRSGVVLSARSGSRGSGILIGKRKSGTLPQRNNGNSNTFTNKHDESVGKNGIDASREGKGEGTSTRLKRRKSRVSITIDNRAEKARGEAAAQAKRLAHGETHSKPTMSFDGFLRAGSYVGQISERRMSTNHLIFVNRTSWKLKQHSNRMLMCSVAGLITMILAQQFNYYLVDDDIRVTVVESLRCLTSLSTVLTLYFLTCLYHTFWVLDKTRYSVSLRTSLNPVPLLTLSRC